MPSDEEKNEESKPRHFKGISVLPAFVVRAHEALEECRFVCRTPDQTNQRNNTRVDEGITGKLEPRRFQRLSVLQAFVASAHHALEQCSFACHAPDERSQYI